MTSEEKELFEIAKEVLSLNQHVGAMLTGSLMLEHRGIRKRREATDIDILVSSVTGGLYVPSGFIEREITTEEEYEESEYQRFYENKDGIQIDFFQTSEIPTIVKGVMCGCVEILIAAKESYGSEKHDKDLKFLKMCTLKKILYKWLRK